MLALYALRFSLNKNVKDMSVESNVDGFGAFDDVKLQVEYHTKETKLYLIQLKHKEKGNVRITESELLSSKNNKKFSLDKYKKSYDVVRSRLGSEDYNLDEVIFCLVTNANLPNISTISLEPSHVICHLVSNSIQNLQEDYIYTKSKIFVTFNIQSPSTKEELEYSTFFRNFRFYDKQANYKETENEIVNLLETSFGVKNPEITKTFIRFIEAECERKRRLTKKNVKIKLLELLTGVTDEMLLLKKYETFEDITDLNNYDERVKILKEISISLQGRTPMNLYDLTNKSFHETVSVSFLLKNIKETVNVGSKFFKRPDNYIERRFYKILLKQNILWKTTKIIFLLDTPLPPALTGKIKILTDLQTNNFLSCRFIDKNLAVIVSMNTFSETIKYIKEHRDLTGFSLHHVKVHDTRYLEWQRSWSNREDLSKFIVHDESVNEQEVLKHFKSNLNVVSAIPGMGKTTILNTLAHHCEPDVLALKLDLKTHERDLINEDSELRQNLLNYVCGRMQTGENSEIEKELFKHLKGENRLILFVDAFDEISPMHSNAVLSIIEKLKENQIPIWIFTRPLVMSILQKHFSIIPINMVPLGNDDIKNYLIQSVGEELDEEVDSSLTDNVLDLCSAPLYLNMYAAIIREKQVNLRGLKMTDLYEHFTEMSFQNHMEKRNVDENTNDLIDVRKLYKEKYINVHKTAALVVFFGENFLLENEILEENDIKNIRDFKTGEKNYELIVFVDDGIPTFSHRTYAEYFAALKVYEYLQKKNFHILYEHLFEEKYQGVRAMFDRISAKTLPLHLAVVEEDFDKVERLCDDLSSSKIYERDEFGRTVLHFAMNSCKFSDLPVEENVPIEIVDLLMRHFTKDEAIFKQCDDILDLNFYQHAKKCENVSLLHLAAYYGTISVIECLIDVKDSNIDFNIKSETGKTPIHCAAENGYFDIVTLLKDNGGNINETDQDGWTALHYSTYQQDEECVDFLIKEGADINCKTKDCRAPIHYAVETGNVKIIRLLKQKDEGIDDCDIEILHYASASGQEASVYHLIKIGSNINGKDSNGKTPIHLAAENGHSDIIKLLKEKGGRIDDVDLKGMTPLHYASECGFEDCVDYLTNEGANVNQKENEGRTPIHYAADGGYVNVIRLLKDNGGRIDEVDEDGLTPLHYAVIRGRIDCFKYLTESGADTSKSDAFGRAPIHYAAKYGNVDIIKYLIKHENVNICDVDSEGLTALHYAARKGTIKCLEFLLKEGADVNQKTKDGRTPIHCSAEKGHVKAMELLMQKGGNINDFNLIGETALHYASSKGLIKCVDYLIAQELDVNEWTNFCKTPMFYAAKYDYPKVISLLKGKGARIDDFNWHGLTVLHYAALNGSKHSLATLLEAGENSNKKSRDRRTPMHYAAQNGHVDIIELLKQKGAEIDAVDSKGFSPLHYAALEGNKKCINHLIKSSEDINKKAINGGGTPVHFSAQGGHMDVLKYLKEKGGNIYETDSMGLTPLHCASQNGHTKCVEYLLKENFELSKKEQDGKSEDIDELQRLNEYVNRKSADGRTPLHYAAFHGHLGTVRLLLKEKGLRIDDTDSVGMTAFHLAVRGRTDCLNHLIKAGADINKATIVGRTPIHSCAERGYTDVIRVLIKKGGNIYETDSLGQTALHYASRYGQMKCAEYLLGQSLDVNKKTNDKTSAINETMNLLNKKGDDNETERLTELVVTECIVACIKISAGVNKTPMHYVAEGGHLDLMKLLAKKGGRIDDIDSEGFTVFHLAAYSGNIECLKYLIKSGVDDINQQAKDGRTPMHCAAENGNLEVITFLNHEGVSVNQINLKGETPLHIAAQRANYRCMEHLIQKGADVNKTTNLNRTPMFYGTRKDYPVILKLLKDSGGIIDGVDSERYTALHHAVLNGSKSCSKYLIEVGAVVNQKGKDEKTPLHCAAKVGRVDIIKLLIDKDARIDDVDANKWTPFHHAASQGSVQCLDYLLNASADINPKAIDGKNPMHCAAENGHVEVIRFLKEKNLNVNETDMLGQTPLHYATINGHPNCMKYLITAGANVDQKTCDGSTPLSLAVENLHADAVKLLEDEGALV